MSLMTQWLCSYDSFVRFNHENRRCARAFPVRYSCCCSALECLAVRRSAWEKVGKFGTPIEERLNINQSKFGVSNSDSLAPPTVQMCTIVYASNFWTVGLETKWFLHFTKILLFRSSPRPSEIESEHADKNVRNLSRLVKLFSNNMRTNPKCMWRYNAATLSWVLTWRYLHSAT